LRDAVRAAQSVGLSNAAAPNTNDCLLLYLPRWHGNKIKIAAFAAGIDAFRYDIQGRTGYVFPPPHNSDSGSQIKQAKAMRYVMVARGYDAGVFVHLP